MEGVPSAGPWGDPRRRQARAGEDWVYLLLGPTAPSYVARLTACLYPHRSPRGRGLGKRALWQDRVRGWSFQMTIWRFQVSEGAQSLVKAPALPGVSPEAPGCRGAGPGPMLKPGPLSPVRAGAARGPAGAGRGAARTLRFGRRGPGAGASDAEVPGGRGTRRRHRSGRAQLGPAARPVLPGAAKRAHRRQVGPGPRAPGAPAGGGRRTGAGRARGRVRCPAQRGARARVGA